MTEPVFAMPLYPVFFDLTGKPLDAGFIYIGASGENAEASPVQAYWDEAQTTPAPQPIRTISGYPSRNGSPAAIYVSGDYSVTVRDKDRGLVYSAKTGVNIAKAATANVEAAAASVAGDVDQIIAFTGAQMQTVSVFTSFDQFETYDAVFSYPPLNSFVHAGNAELQKRTVGGANAWVVHGNIDPLLDGYLPKSSGSVGFHHITKMPAFTIMANDLAVAAQPYPVTYDKILSTLGAKVFGTTANGGGSVPKSSVDPNAPNAWRQARGTSLAGQTDVTFFQPFAPCEPVIAMSVIIANAAAGPLIANIIDGTVTEDGFSFVIKNLSGTAVAAEYHYQARGQDD